jgi:hypothetical protein
VRLIAQPCRMAAARLAEGRVLELSRRPPEIWLLGARVSQEVKCFSEGQRRISVPISAMSCNAACGPMLSIWLKSAPPVSRWSRPRTSKAGGCLETRWLRASGSGAVGGGCRSASVESNASISPSHSAVCLSRNS